MDIVSYVLSRKYTDNTVIGLGAIKGAPCTIKSAVHQDGQNILTFEWTGNDGTKQTTVITIYDGTPIYEWISGDHYKYGDLVIYSGAFYRCIVANSDITFDSTKWSEIGGADSQYDIVEDSSQLPTRFTPADRRMYYSIQDCAFWLWDGYRWSLQERAITDTEIMQLFA